MLDALYSNIGAKINLSTSAVIERIKKLKNVAVMTVDGTGRYYLQEYGEKYTVGKIETEAKW